MNLEENDPEDISGGYGGLPNDEGVVELDAWVMHGPTHNAGGLRQGISSIRRWLTEGTSASATDT